MWIKAVTRVSKQTENLIRECLCEASIPYKEIKERVKEVRNMMPPFFLCMEEKDIIGCLCLYDADEEDCYGEIFFARAHTEKRDQMIQELIAELEDYGFTKLYLCNEMGSNKSLTPYMQVESTDYMMKASKLAAVKIEEGLAAAKQKQLKLIPYDSTKHETFYLKLLVEVFGMDSNESLTRAQELKEDTQMRGYVLTDADNQWLGMTGCYVQSSTITLFDVAVTKKQQDSGYGKAMLSLLLELLMTEKKSLLLQVNSKSSAAFHLYQQFGFQITEQLDHPVISFLKTESVH